METHSGKRSDRECAEQTSCLDFPQAAFPAFESVFSMSLSGPPFRTPSPLPSDRPRTFITETARFSSSTRPTETQFSSSTDQRTFDNKTSSSDSVERTFLGVRSSHESPGLHSLPSDHSIFSATSASPSTVISPSASSPTNLPTGPLSKYEFDTRQSITKYREFSNEVYHFAQAQPVSQKPSAHQSCSVLNNTHFLDITESSEPSASDSSEFIEDTDLSLTGPSQLLVDSHSDLSHAQRQTEYFKELVLGFRLQFANMFAIQEDGRGIQILNFSRGKVVFPEEHNLYSAFSCYIDEEDKEVVEPNYATKLEPNGFDVSIFFKSVTLLKQPLIVKYNLRGNGRELHGFVTSMGKRRIEIGGTLHSIWGETAGCAPVAPEFESVAADFFNGKEVLEEYQDTKEKSTVIVKPNNYKITYDSDWSKVLLSQPWTDKSLITFLQDVHIANQLEKALIQKANIEKCRVFRHETYETTIRALKAIAISDRATARSVTSFVESFHKKFRNSSLYASQFANASEVRVIDEAMAEERNCVATDSNQTSEQAETTSTNDFTPAMHATESSISALTKPNFEVATDDEDISSVPSNGNIVSAAPLPFAASKKSGTRNKTQTLSLNKSGSGEKKNKRRAKKPKSVISSREGAHAPMNSESPAPTSEAKSEITSKPATVRLIDGIKEGPGDNISYKLANILPNIKEEIQMSIVPYLAASGSKTDDTKEKAGATVPLKPSAYGQHDQQLRKMDTRKPTRRTKLDQKEPSHMLDASTADLPIQANSALENLVEPPSTLMNAAGSAKPLPLPFSNDLESLPTSASQNDGWVEVKSKASQKNRSTSMGRIRPGSIAASKAAKIKRGGGGANPVQKLRVFDPKEYPAMPSTTLTSSANTQNLAQSYIYKNQTPFINPNNLMTVSLQSQVEHRCTDNKSVSASKQSGLACPSSDSRLSYCQQNLEAEKANADLTDSNALRQSRVLRSDANKLSRVLESDNSRLESVTTSASVNMGPECNNYVQDSVHYNLVESVSDGAALISTNKNNITTENTDVKEKKPVNIAGNSINTRDMSETLSSPETRGTNINSVSMINGKLFDTRGNDIRAGLMLDEDKSYENIADVNKPGSNTVDANNFNTKDHEEPQEFSPGGIEWATDLTSPTKFRAGPRRSSLSFVASIATSVTTTAATDGIHHDDPPEPSLNRYRGLSLNSFPIKLLQFGDLPIRKFTSVAIQSMQAPTATQVPNVVTSNSGPQGTTSALSNNRAIELYESSGNTDSFRGPELIQDNVEDFPISTIEKQEADASVGHSSSGIQSVDCFRTAQALDLIHNMHLHAHPTTPLLSPSSSTSTSIAISGTDNPLSSAEPDESNVNMEQARSYECYLCSVSLVPTIHNPLLFCVGCGPNSVVRYCSIACLLADSFSHAQHCVKHPDAERQGLSFSFPPEYQFEMSPLPRLGYFEMSPALFRQMAFSMYCYTGDFPQILSAWAKTQPSAVTQMFDLNESSKRTGDYHIFRSTYDSSHPQAEVIFTVKLRKGDPLKAILNRALNAAFTSSDARVVDFLFRLLHHLILDTDLFQGVFASAPQTAVLQQFHRQFTEEFGQNVICRSSDPDTFVVEKEWPMVEVYLNQLESRFPQLRQWLRI